MTAVVAVAALALGLAACGGAASDARSDARVTTPTWVTGVGGSLTVGIDNAPTGCNPNTASGGTWANNLVLAPVLPSSFVVNANGQSVYDSAVITQAELQNTNPQTIVYTINPKAVWSDGVPISASDFVYAWQQQRGVAAGGTTDDVATTQGYRDIQSVTGSNGGKTVTVVFKNPFADWRSLFNNLLPAHVMEHLGWDPPCTTVDPTVDLSGGPYVIETVVPGKEIVLTRNPQWWETPPNLSQVVIRIAGSASQLASWVADGQAQVVQPTSYDQAFLDYISSKPRLESDEQVSSTFLQLEFATGANAVTDDVRIREAVAHAVDRQALASSVVGWSDNTIVPSNSHLYVQTQEAYPGPTPQPPEVAAQPGSASSTTKASALHFPLTAEPTETSRLLGEADYTRGPLGWIGPDAKPLTLRLAVDAGDTWAAQTGDLLARQLEDQGIAVTTSEFPSATATGQALASGAADMALLPRHTTPYPSSAIAWYTTLLGQPGQDGSQDWSNFSSTQLENLLTGAAHELNPVTAQPTYAQADQLLWQQMVALPLFAEPAVAVWSSTIGGVGLNPNGPGLLWNLQTWGHLVPPTAKNTAPAT